MIQAIPYIGEPATLPIISIRAAAQIRMRNGFDEESLSELAATIKAVGIIEPLIVRPDPEEAAHYILIAGERRLLAASMAGLAEVPVIVREIDSREAATVQAIENLQREDLTLADTAEGVAKLIEHYKTPAAVAKILGKSAAWVSKRAGVLKAHADVRAVLMEGLTDDAELLLTLSQIRKLPDAAGMPTFERLVNGLRAGTTTRTSARDALTKLKNPNSASAEGDDIGEKESNQPKLFIDVTLGLTKAQHEKLQELGGAKWLVEQIDAA
jgi:ParB family chromosome partitioning protein